MISLHPNYKAPAHSIRLVIRAIGSMAEWRTGILMTASSLVSGGPSASSARLSDARGIEEVVLQKAGGAEVASDVFFLLMAST